MWSPFDIPIHDTYYVLLHVDLWMYAIIVFLIGLCFGSFATMASYRWPRDEEWVKTPSRCPSCRNRLTWRDLFPIFSYLFTRGRCRQCHAAIGVRYPLTELACGLIWVGLFFVYGPTGLYIVMALFTTALLILLIADLETGLIPDELHWFLLPLGVVYHWLLGSDPAIVAAAATTGFGIGLLLHYGWYWLRGYHGLGFGDVKFLLVIGLWLGQLELLVVFLFYAGILGIATGLLWKCFSKDPRFPFGPALAVALWALVIFPQSANWFWNGMRALISV